MIVSVLVSVFVKEAIRHMEEESGCSIQGKLEYEKPLSDKGDK